MLAKWWKKIALFVCIIAVLFNITYKIVHRTNIKQELTSVLGGEAIKFSEDKENVENTNSKDTK
ncbi:MAG: hypothetical protein HFJ45_09790 [Clostridia bacterium]|nr:hypothetical protein [Clostridia bacterium]